MTRPPVTVVSDRRRPMPGALDERRDAIALALASLASEERRVARLGLAPALARVRAERRYWRFLDAVHLPPRAQAAPPDPGASPWPDRAAR
uniref:Uncharacterized protein n=1 Tax=Eiseniibacteriota bacterium TaxID=2212470 RepID=A0A832I7R1_UNCEI